MIEGVALQTYDSSEGDGDTSAAVVLEDLPSERQDTFTWTATLSGDYLKVRHAIIDPIELVDVVIYKRFDCPAIGETASNPDQGLRLPQPRIGSRRLLVPGPRLEHVAKRSEVVRSDDVSNRVASA